MTEFNITLGHSIALIVLTGVLVSTLLIFHYTRQPKKELKE